MNKEHPALLDKIDYNNPEVVMALYGLTDITAAHATNVSASKWRHWRYDFVKTPDELAKTLLKACVAKGLPKQAVCPIKLRMIEFGYTCSALSVLLRVSRQTVRAWVNGYVNRIDLKSAIRLAKILEITLNDILECERIKKC